MLYCSTFTTENYNQPSVYLWFRNKQFCLESVLRWTLFHHPSHHQIMWSSLYLIDPDAGCM